MTSRDNEGEFLIRLTGPFQFLAPDGSDCTPRGRKACAVLAMLSLSPNGRRARRWLRDHLWSDRGNSQSASSLRQALSEIRRSLGPWRDVLTSDNISVTLNVNRVTPDIQESGQLVGFSTASGLDKPVLLDGLDVNDQVFKRWLADQRDRWLAEVSSQNTPPTSIQDENTEEQSNVVNLLDRGMKGPNAPSDEFYHRPASGSETHLTQQEKNRIDRNRHVPRGQAGIAILPFEVLASDKNAEPLGLGLCAELINRLSRLRWLDVISLSSCVNTYKNVKNPHDISTHLGAKYVLEGKLHEYNDKLVAHMHLINASSGHSIWSGRFDIRKNDSLTSIDQIVIELVGLLDARIDVSEQNFAKNTARQDLDFVRLIWRARWNMNRLSRDDMDLARELIDQALVLDSGSPEALLQHTWWHLTQSWLRRGGDVEARAIREMAQQAIIADNMDGRGYALAGVAEIWMMRPEQARLLLTQAISLNPSLAYAYSQLGTCYIQSSEPEKAIEPLVTSLRLSPHDQLEFFALGELAMANCLMGNHAEAVDYSDQSLILRPKYWYAHVVKINALHVSKMPEDVGHAVHEFRTACPTFDIDAIRWIPFVDRDCNLELSRNLISAGIDQGTPKPGDTRIKFPST